jgi:hypothetical protein
LGKGYYIGGTDIWVDEEFMKHIKERAEHKERVKKRAEELKNQFSDYWDYVAKQEELMYGQDLDWTDFFGPPSDSDEANERGYCILNEYVEYRWVIEPNRGVLGAEFVSRDEDGELRKVQVPIQILREIMEHPLVDKRNRPQYPKEKEESGEQDGMEHYQVDAVFVEEPLIHMQVCKTGKMKEYTHMIVEDEEVVHFGFHFPLEK